MQLSDFLAQDGNAESAQGNPGVTCNALNKIGVTQLGYWVGLHPE